jgi:hypothetical protein
VFGVNSCRHPDGVEMLEPTEYRGTLRRLGLRTERLELLTQPQLSIIDEMPDQRSHAQQMAGEGLAPQLVAERGVRDIDQRTGRPAVLEPRVSTPSSAPR